MSSPYLLDAQNLTVSFNTGHGKKRQTVHALNAASMLVSNGEIHGLVGESGSGKSTFARAVCGLQTVTSGAVVFDGTALDDRRSKEQRREIQMVFQDPYASLDPRFTVRDVLSEIIKFHHTAPKDQIENRCKELMDLVQLPEAFLDNKPDSMSGGQRQRVAIARALAANPSLLIADEAVAALDVSVQAGIINLMLDLRDQQGITILFIAHNLAVVHNICDRISVIYLGCIVEEASTEELFSNPLHPYTRRLLSAVPRLDGRQTVVPSVQDPEHTILPDGNTGTYFDPSKDRCKWSLLSVDTKQDHYVACKVS
ncbi:ATP-binding cassette domain-containing protein [Bifidobacterium amazonense]|uniref:ATP-binding cassette domain-containing protein n=1 Tax=Bifidobacterium amazonense TaxID=2809027 RepID=A0ABS9VSN7_9BIFI|nr:ATP-binding cassette domain-containing protein [Bifidobacterium amazonense]MCH9275092.1 ATP-binding cassette domain-containing protein [Bifidobacterium amazonense]